MIYIDANEASMLRVGGKAISDALRAIDVPVDVRKLPCDYVIKDADGVYVCLERKTVNDLISSLLTGRVFRELDSLSSIAEEVRPIFFYHGSFKGAERVLGIEKIRIAMSMIAMFAYRLNIPIVYIPTREIPSFLKTLHYQAQTKGKKVSVRFPKRYGTLYDAQLNVVTMLPGVGGEVGKQLLEELNTLRALANADEGELKKVRGVGKEIARRVYELFNTPIDEAKKIVKKKRLKL